MEERPNFYLLLELSYDPSETNERIIEQAIKDKKLEWGRKVNHPRNGQKFRDYLGFVPMIEQVMLDSELRMEEANEAREIKKAEIVKQEKEINKKLNGLINVLSSKGYVTPEEIKRIGKEVKLSTEEIEKELVVPIQVDASDSIFTSEKESDCLQLEKMKQIGQLLHKLSITPKVGSVLSLYDALDQPEQANLIDLFSLSQEQYRKYQNKGKGSSITENKKQVYSQAKTIFESDELRRKYDEALKEMRFKMIIPYIEVAAINGKIDFPVYKQLLKEAANEGLNKDDAKQKIGHYCQKQKILLMTTKVTKSNDLEFQQCGSCGSVNKDDAYHCHHCGFALQTTCYSCQSKIQVGDVRCTQCGVYVAGKYHHDRLLKNGYLALYVYDLFRAEEAFLKAQYYYKSSEVLNAFQKVSNVRKEMESQLARVEAEVKKKRYYGADQEWNRLLKFGSFAKEHESIRHEITNRLSMTESFLKRASEAKSLEEASRYYFEAIECSVDCKLALNKINSYPPEPPSQLTVSVHEEEISLTWAPSPSEGNLVYQIVRKEGSPSSYVGDGEVIGEVNGSTYTDYQTDVGKSYFYAVVTKRFSTLSKTCVINGPVMRLAEVEQLEARPESGDIHLRWKASAKTKVEVWKKEGSIPTGRGDGIKLNGVKGNEVVDREVDSDKQYGYLVISQYVDQDGKFLLSNGKSIMTMGIEIEPLMSFTAKIKGNQAIIKAGKKPNDELFFFVANRPFKLFKLRDFYSFSTLKTKLKNAACKQADVEGTCMVNVVRNQTTYILPVTKNGDAAVIGMEKTVKEIEDVFGVTGKTEKDGSFYLQWTWPKDIEEVLVVYSEKDFPKEPTEAGTIQRSCSKTAYQAFNGYKIDNIYNFKEIFFTLYVGEEMNGKKVYSQGTSFYHTNVKPIEILYSVDMKGLFKKKAFLTVNSSNPDVLSPELVVVKQVGRHPLSRKDGVEVWKIEEGTDLHSLEIDLSYYQESNACFKLFYQNEKDSMRFLLEPIGDLTTTR